MMKFPWSRVVDGALLESRPWLAGFALREWNRAQTKDPKTKKARTGRAFFASFVET
ncbi:hypothetical protein ACVWWQ_000389 [Rhodanobacter sp. TND4EL1]